MEKRKAQAALEFLVTYGWAILAIAIVLGVLVATGIFRPAIKKVCGINGLIDGLTCKDFKIKTVHPEFTIRLVNNIGEDIIIEEINVSEQSKDCVYQILRFKKIYSSIGETQIEPPFPENITLFDGEEATIESGFTHKRGNCGIKQGDPWKGEITILYEQSGITHTATAPLMGVVE